MNQVPQQKRRPRRRKVSKKKRLVALLLCAMFGPLGIHRFYVGKIGTGILWFFTLGILGLGPFVDFWMIIFGAFRDKRGRKLKNWL